MVQSPPARRYTAIVGTGGIGSGISMRLEGDHILGREESRPVTLIDGRDYCKLHIVFHYLRLLVGEKTPVLPIGRVGDDVAGRALLRELASIGMDLTFVGTVADKATLFSIAFRYPSGDGGNLTTVHSASDDVTAADVRAAEPQLRAFRRQGIAVALPEVPLEARAELLTMATELGFLRVATFVSAEAETARAAGMLDQIDLLVLNADEATAFTGVTIGVDGHDSVRHVVNALRSGRGNLAIVVTAGVRGSWSWDGDSLAHAPALPAVVDSTAGAGDAHLAGILYGLLHGMSLHEANRVGSLLSSLKVRSPHTINPDINPVSVRTEAIRVGISLPSPRDTASI